MKKLIYISFSLLSLATIAQTTTTTVGSLKINNTPATVTGNQYQLVRNPVTKLVEQQLISGSASSTDTTSDHYKGQWNASTNTPILANGTGQVGDYYLVNVAGTALGYDFKGLDKVWYDGAIWRRDSLAKGLIGTTTGNDTSNPIIIKNGGLEVTLNYDDLRFIYNTGNVDPDFQGGINEFGSYFYEDNNLGTVKGVNYNTTDIRFTRNAGSNFFTGHFKYPDSLLSDQVSFKLPNVPANIDNQDFTLPIKINGYTANTIGEVNIPVGNNGTVTQITGTDGVTVANGTTTPVIGLGEITPTSVNGVSSATMQFVDPTSSIQTQLNGKANIASPTFTGTVTLPAGQVINNVTLTTGGSASNFLNATGTYTAPPPASPTNITYTPSSTNGAIASSTGTGATINVADATNAGLLLPSEKTKLTNLSGTNTGDNAVNSLYNGLVSNATHTGDATGATALTVRGINGQLMSSLPTGIVKNTNSTGVPSIAIASDFPILNQSTTGNAGTATALQTGRTINGVTFDGTQNITISTAAPNLTGDVTSVGVATTYNNVVPSAKGGAGTITGLLKANGAGVVSQAIAGTDYLASITSANVTNALGFTPYNATNPNGYVSPTGTVTNFSGNLGGEVNGTQGSAVLLNGAVTGKILTGLTSTAGTIQSTDSILSAIGKLNGNTNAKQDALVSGTNIKTINGTSVLGNGDLVVSGNTNLNDFYYTGFNTSGEIFSTVNSSQLSIPLASQDGNGNTAGLTENNFSDALESKLNKVGLQDETNLSFFTDFLSGSSTTANTVWLTGAVSFGTSPVIATTSINNPGVVRMSSSTTANSGYRWQTDFSSILLKGGEEFTAIINPVTFTSTTVRIGFLDTATSADAVDGVYFEYSLNGSVQLKTSNNSTRTTSPTITTLTAGSWYKLKVKINSPTSATGTVYNNLGVNLGSQTITTNIPTGTGRQVGSGIIATNSGTVATGLLDVDFLKFSNTLVR
jgi:hypothetical protein